MAGGACGLWRDGDQAGGCRRPAGRGRMGAPPVGAWGSMGPAQPHLNQKSVATPFIRPTGSISRIDDKSVSLVRCGNSGSPALGVVGGADSASNRHAGSAEIGGAPAGHGGARRAKDVILIPGTKRRAYLHENRAVRAWVSPPAS